MTSSHSRRRRLSARAALAAAAALVAAAAPAALGAAPAAAAPQWHAKTPPISTPWTSQVGPDNALPEYPRPQLTRKAWQNLNGVWQFAGAEAGEKPPVGQKLAERILVPYPVESALSGIMRHEDRMWYRRTVTVPKSWNGKHLLLHFGAVDYDTTVWVNGVKVAHHLGGYDAFSADITSAVHKGGTQEILVGVSDPTDAGGQPIGKQRNDPGGIFYTPTSGIWQTVWMEPVGYTHVDSLVITPDVARKTLRVRPVVVGARSGDTVVVTASSKGKRIARASGAAGSTVTVAFAKPHLWSPNDPFLYDLSVVVKHRGKAVDTVGSYAGLRSVSMHKDARGRAHLMLNGKPVFAMATLDQGFWPDGIYTAPTDAALEFDLAQHKQLGFNSVRKHIKVEPARWYYWADKLGLMVWQDMPAMDIKTPSDAAKAEYRRELKRMIDQHRSETSIIAWVPFNEGWGEFDPKPIAQQVKAWDPTRLVDAQSGVNCCYSAPDSGAGDVYDDHTYVGPGTPPSFADRISIDGEYGGFGLVVDGHVWPGPPGAYEMEPDSATLTEKYVQAQQRLLKVEQQCGVSAGIYTQITDVENEVNGLWTYDRRVLKMDGAQVRKANRAVIAAAPSAYSDPNGPTYPAGQQAPVASYELDEGSGTVAHDDAGDHDATVTGDPSWVPGHAGTALQLDGSTQSAQTQGTVVDTSGNFSVGAWVKLDSTGHFATAVGEDGNGASAFFLQYSQADNRFAFSTVGGRALSDTAPETGRWYHLVGVHDASAGTYTLYVDGKAQQQVHQQCIGDSATGPLTIGRGQYGGNPADYWPGALDDVRVWNRALSASDVADLG
ncbi:LamG-like jellyroll fold domain-containing protein [Jatrophihabitans fulvus]